VGTECNSALSCNEGGFTYPSHRDTTISRLNLNLSYENRVNYYINLGEIVDIANGLFSTPARGIRHEIGNNAVVAGALWKSATWLGVLYSGYLHTMASVLGNLDCN
jgi:hypothetical protein